MSKDSDSRQRCGLCGEILWEEGPGTCKACWTIQLTHNHASEQVAQSLTVLAECRHSLEILKVAPERGEKMALRPTDAFIQEILRNYSVELANLFSLRTSQRELRMKLELRRGLKKD